MPENGGDSGNEPSEPENGNSGNSGNGSDNEPEHEPDSDDGHDDGRCNDFYCLYCHNGGIDLESEDDTVYECSAKCTDDGDQMTAPNDDPGFVYPPDITDLQWRKLQWKRLRHRMNLSQVEVHYQTCIMLDTTRRLLPCSPRFKTFGPVIRKKK